VVDHVAIPGPGLVNGDVGDGTGEGYTRYEFC